MKFQEIEEALGRHCDTSKCVRDRIEVMRQVKALEEAGKIPFKPETLPRPSSPFPKDKR